MDEQELAEALEKIERYIGMAQRGIEALRRHQAAPKAKKRKRKAPVNVDWSVVDGLNQEAWAEWLAERRARGDRPYKTTRPATHLVSICPSHEAQQAAIDQSIARNWTGLFPSKDSPSHKVPATNMRFL